MDIEKKIVSHIKKNIANEQDEKGLFDLPEESHIRKKIEVLKNMQIEILANFFESNQKDCSAIDWDNVLRTLQEEVLVKYDPGKGLIDDTEEYDKQWFSKIKITDKYNSYYSERFNDYYKEKLGPQVRYTLSRDTESILNLCGSPKRDSVKQIRGLVFGYVQSGKTLNYASVSNSAMGAGYDMIIILAGATNILREQTQNRLNHDLIGQYNGKSIGVGKFNNIPSKKPISLTTPITDFNTKEANSQTNGINLENIRVPVIAVIKKNVTPLKNLKDWIENQSGGSVLKKSLLLIDDESDYASINTNEEQDPTSINRGIRDILNSFDVATYLAVTATPFANILINHEVTNDEYGADLFPRSFIWALDKPETYIGVREALGKGFVDVYNLDLDIDENVIQDELKFVFTAKKENKFEYLPYYIKSAICTFLYNSTCLRQERPKTDHLSMLVNISRFTNHHIEISGLVKEFTDDLYRAIRNSSIDRIDDEWLIKIKELVLIQQHGFNSIDEFWKELEVNLSFLEIFDIHQSSKVTLEYPIELKRNSILIGGLSLSRGFTIEGLITSVFIRTTKTFDALMQMGRWFGHKKHILKYINVFTTPTIRNRFELIDESIIDLLLQIDEMIRLKLPPKDFGLNIRRHPNVIIETAVRQMRSRQGLDVVSRSKRKSAQEITLKLSLGNRIMETVRFINDKDSAVHNNQLVHDFLHNLDSDVDCNRYSTSSYPSLFVEIQKDKEKILGFLDVSNSHIRDFIMNFKLPSQKLSETSAKLPLRFLSDFLSKPENNKLKWDVSLISGSGGDEKRSVHILGDEYFKVKRSFEQSKDNKSIKLPKNQLSIPSHEFRFLNEEVKEPYERSKGRELRKMTGKPLLLIFPIHPTPSTDEDLDLSIFNTIDLWGWSISMPGSKNDDDYISVLANSVFVKELVEDYTEDLEYEDY
jgi:hypothetical protein